MAQQPTPVSADVRQGSTDRFGYEWHHYSEIRPEYEEQFRRWTCLLEQEDWIGVTFLDVGCGMGRNSYWPMTYGAAGGISIDLDDRSLAAAARNLSKFPSVTVRRMSAYDIDLPQAVDIAFSIGVIHHLQHPDEALRSMVRATRPGGRVLIWVYGLENNRWITYGLTPIRKFIFSKLPISVVHLLSWPAASLLWVLLRLGFGGISYFQLLRKFTFAHIRSIVFDQMLPKIAHYWPQDTVEALLRDAGLVDIKTSWVNEMSWSAIGTRPKD
jgi:SAM-dependent methyltransferase